jgi:hypothetical protein
MAAHELLDFVIESMIAAVLIEGDQLPDSAVVVRGGQMRLDDLVLAAKNTRNGWRRPGISVHASDALTVGQIARIAGLPQPVVRLSMAGTLRAAGFELEATSDPPHFTIWLDPENASDDALEAECERVRDLFSPPQKKPME